MTRRRTRTRRTFRWREGVEEKVGAEARSGRLNLDRLNKNMFKHKWRKINKFKKTC